jgi:hypothetical protein
MWPKVPPDADISGGDVLAFYARTSPTGKYANISKQLGITTQTPTRAIATADTTGTGTLDFAVARQWGPPAFYANTASNLGQHLDFQLYRPNTGTAASAGGSQAIGTPAYDATVAITNPQGTAISELDGGSGHGGFRSFGVHFGLGSYSGPSTVTVNWRDTNGTLHQQSEQFTPGNHTLMLTDHVQEVSSQ